MSGRARRSGTSSRNTSDTRGGASSASSGPSSSQGRGCGEGSRARCSRGRRSAIVQTELDDGGGIGSSWARLDCAVTNTITEVGVGAKADSVRLALHIGAAEGSSLSKHVVDASLTACRQIREGGLCESKADKGGSNDEGLHG